jgi:hypothetical protein
MLSLWDLTCVTFSVLMAFPVFHEFDTDGTIRTNGLHWEGFPRLAWEALSAAHHSTDLRGVRVRALGRSPFQGDHHCATTPGPRRLVRLELCLLGFCYPRDRRVSCSSSVHRLLRPQSYRGGSLSIRAVLHCESSQPGMAGSYGSS